uniref:Uncharacterized protein n=1 Tax=Anguilla anguilla TaxID=7936 RepID=A0A0E9W5U0_ANGAN
MLTAEQRSGVSLSRARGFRKAGVTYARSQAAALAAAGFSPGTVIKNKYLTLL